MRRTSAVLLSCTVLVATLAAQDARVLTHPSLPNPGSLARAGLKQRWWTYLPMDGRRDGIGFVQALDGQILVQTASGGVICLDGNTGATQWRIRLGDPYQTLRQPAAANRHVFLIVAGMKVYGIDRKTGIVEFDHEAPGVLSAAPALDDSFGYLCLADGRVNAYSLPTTDATGAERGGQSTTGGVDAYGKVVATSKVTPLWSIQANAAVTEPPVVFPNDVIFANREGTVQSFLKERSIPVDKFQTNVGIAAPLAKQDNWLYVASEDFNLYAFEVDQGLLKLRWQHVVPSAIVQKPWVIGDEIYVLGKAGGTECLDRMTGAVKWQQPLGDRFVACSRRLCIVADKNGKLLCLDRQRGQLVSTWDASAYARRVSNDSTDRIYLANHDGLVVCFQDAEKSHDQPLFHNPLVEKEMKKPKVEAPPPETKDEK